MKKLFLCTLFILLFILLTQPAISRQLTPKEIYRHQGLGVVLIMATHGGTTGSLGTGSIVRGDGLVITNFHVIFDQSRNKFYKKVYIFLKPDKISGDNKKDLKNYYVGQVLRYNEKLDLALLKIKNAPSKLTVIPFADSEEIEVGDEVVAIGHPEQAGLWTLTTGTISSVIANLNGVKGKDVFQTEASINRGNSGGPLLDYYGHMVGVNTLIYRQAPDGLVITDINFALKAKVAQEWLYAQGLKLALAKKPASERIVQASDEEALPETGTALQEEQERAAPAPVTAEQPTLKVVEETPKMIEGPAQAPAVEVKPVQPERAPETAEAPEIVKEIKPEQPEEAPEVTAKVEPEEKKAEIITEKRPYNTDDLIEERMREMESLMDEMRKIFQR